MKKVNGKWRMCVDYPALNTRTVGDRYPLPSIESILSQLGGSTVFSKKNLVSKFHQIRIHDKDVKKTAFNTQFGALEWVVMPFGLCNAPSTFQRVVNDVLRDHLGIFVWVYIDDILIFSKDADDHQQHLDLLHELLCRHQLFPCINKSTFFQSRVSFCGYNIDRDRVQMDAEKIKVIRGWPLPTTVNEVRQFIRLCGFYQQFVEGFQAVAAPLAAMFKADFEWEWTAVHQASFDKLKQAMINATHPSAIDPRQPYHLCTDALKDCMGATLAHRCKGHLRPFAFMSRKMQPAESRYPIREQELLAMVLALKQWFHLLRGPQQVHVHTDHESLRYFQTCPRPLTPQQARWCQFLEEYNLTLWDVPGLENPAADACSRLTLRQLMDIKNATRTLAFVVPLVENWVSPEGEPVDEFLHGLDDSFSYDEVWPQPCEHLYVSLRSGRSARKEPDVDEDAEPAFQFDTEPAIEPDDLEPLPSNETAVEPEDLEPLPSKEILTENSHQPEVHLDDAGNEPDTSTDTDDLPDIDMNCPLRVTFGKERRCAPTLTELFRCRRHRDGTLQSVPLPQGGPNTPYRSSLKDTLRRVHRHYQCKDLTSTTVWAAAYREDPRRRHIYEVAVRSPAARHQLCDAKLSFHDGKCFHLSTMGKCVLVPRTLVTSIVVMYHKPEFYGHSGVLPTMALIKRDYICSHLRHYVERYILSCDVCQAAKSRRVDSARQRRPLPVPDTKWHSVSIDWVSGLPSTTRGHEAIMTVVDRFSKRGMFIPCRKDMPAGDLVYVFLREVILLKGWPRQIVSDQDKLFKSQAWKELTQRFKIEMHQTVANRPRGSGLAERSNQSVLQRLRTHGIFGINEWDVDLLFAEIQFNNLTSNSLRLSPFEIDDRHPIFHQVFPE